MMMKPLMLLLVLLVLPVSAKAADSKGVYNITGAGTKSCGYWTSERQKKGLVEKVLLGWGDGYLTAYNRYVHTGTDVAQGTDGPGMWAWIDNFCQANPTEAIAAAMDALMIHLKSR